MSKVFGYHIDYHRGDAPLTPGKLLSEAEYLEILKHPFDDTRAYLVAVWADETRYVQGWDRKFLEGFLQQHDLLERVEAKDQVTWSSAHEKYLLTGAKPCPGRGWCNHQEHHGL